MQIVYIWLKNILILKFNYNLQNQIKFIKFLLIFNTEKLL